jgi:hypothetical protein
MSETLPLNRMCPGQGIRLSRGQLALLAFLCLVQKLAGKLKTLAGSSV